LTRMFKVLGPAALERGGMLNVAGCSVSEAWLFNHASALDLISVISFAISLKLSSSSSKVSTSTVGS